MSVRLFVFAALVCVCVCASHVHANHHDHDHEPKLASIPDFVDPVLPRLDELYAEVRAAGELPPVHAEAPPEAQEQEQAPEQEQVQAQEQEQARAEEENEAPPKVTHANAKRSSPIEWRDAIATRDQVRIGQIRSAMRAAAMYFIDAARAPMGTIPPPREADATQGDISLALDFAEHLARKFNAAWREVQTQLEAAPKDAQGRVRYVDAMFEYTRASLYAKPGCALRALQWSTSPETSAFALIDCVLGEEW